MSIPIPEKLKSHSEVLIEPSENKSFPKPGIYEVHHGMVKLENSSHISQAISKDDILVFTELRGNSDTHPSANTRKIFDISNRNMSQFEYLHGLVESVESSLHKAQVDPDNRLSNVYKDCFHDILREYSDIITEVPGRYNGYYGQVN